MRIMSGLALQMALLGATTDPEPDVNVQHDDDPRDDGPEPPVISTYPARHRPVNTANAAPEPEPRSQSRQARRADARMHPNDPRRAVIR